MKFDIKSIEIPENPGVYLMKKNDKVIYVGKAKNLKKRVTSYFNREHDSEKTKELVKNIEDIEFIICKSEIDAFIVENNLIKKYLPKYNILLKDEKTYPYIKFTKEVFSGIQIVRTTKALDLKNGEYFGPYPLGAWNLKNSLVKIFKIRDCTKNMEKTYSRPCLKYYMKTCPAPCVYKDITKEYIELVEGAKEVLKGKGKEVISRLKTQMEQEANEMNFEKAIILRGQIEELERSVTTQISEYGKEIDEDVFLTKKIEDRFFIYVLNIRDGKILGKNFTNISLKDKLYNNLSTDIIIAYYNKFPIPRIIISEDEIVGNSDIIQEILERKTSRKIEIYLPKIKSRRKELLEMARINLDREIEGYYNKKSKIEEGLSILYQHLKLKRYPRKIECFDISNIQGKDAVASMTVSIEGKKAKDLYRKFKITCKDTPDDYKMMEEVITRRYSELPENEFPDVILIDGGLGQINVAGETLKRIGKFGISELLSLAEQEEEIYKYGENLPYKFPKNWEALKIFQRVRDEAHRFGITYHRKLRSKRIISSELDNIKGVGEKRKIILLKEFGSVENIKKQEIDTLKSFVPEKVAQNIYEYFKKN